jgi:hypothetical protein
MTLPNPKANDLAEKVPHSLRRLEVLQEPAGKNRFIVLADFWSQNALAPLHDELMLILRKIPQDSTYNSSESIQHLIKHPKQVATACFDLKSFTERLPLELQEVVLQELYGPDIQKAWTVLMKQEVRHRHEKLVYGCGQQMGILSSWATASLTHHFLIQWFGHVKGNVNLEYRILGDDNVISNPQLSEAYEEGMQALHIPIQKTKTMRTGCTASFEFLKRLFNNGEEVTPLP